MDEHDFGIHPRAIASPQAGRNVEAWRGSSMLNKKLASFIEACTRSYRPTGPRCTRPEDKFRPVSMAEMDPACAGVTRKSCGEFQNHHSSPAMLWMVTRQAVMVTCIKMIFEKMVVIALVSLPRLRLLRQANRPALRRGAGRRSAQRCEA